MPRKKSSQSANVESVPKKGRLVKGSAEAKAFMASIRAMRKQAAPKPSAPKSAAPKKGRFVKGSAEAKAYMASLRAKKTKKV
jgi:hypothetical protein